MLFLARIHNILENLACSAQNFAKFWPFDHGNFKIMVMVMVKFFLPFWPWTPKSGQMVKKIVVTLPRLPPLGVSIRYYRTPSEVTRNSVVFNFRASRLLPSNSPSNFTLKCWYNFSFSSKLRISIFWSIRGQWGPIRRSKYRFRALRLLPLDLPSNFT